MAKTPSSHKKIKDDIDSFTRGESLIENERMRQCGKGFGRDHDDTHTDGSLIRAAIDLSVGLLADNETGEIPEAPEWVQDFVEHTIHKYAKAPIKRLVICASLLVAEIERRQRVEIRKKRKNK